MVDIAHLISEGVSESSLPMRVGDVTIEGVLRWLPARRLVVAGAWKGKPAVMKFFAVGKRGEKAFSREVSALSRLHDYGVTSPDLLDSSSSDRGAILVMSRLEGETALDYCQQGDRSVRQKRILSLVRWVRETQEKGVLQKDIHLGNFFHSGRCWFMLDAAACRFGSLSAREKVKNLADLVAQFLPMDVPDLGDIFHGLGDGGNAVATAREKRYRKILDKAQRDCTEFVRIRRGSLRGMCRREFLEQVLGLLDQGLDKTVSSGNMLKDGNSATVVLESQTGWVIKRYNIKSTWHWLKRQWGRTRSRNAWLAGYFLRTIGVKTPLPVAFMEEKIGCFTRRAWIINVSVSGGGLDRFPGDQELPNSWLKTLSDLFSLMKVLRFSHGDMKASNFIAEDGELAVIDLDSFSLFEPAPVNRRNWRKDAARLLRNWEEGSPVWSSIKKRICAS